MGAIFPIIVVSIYVFLLKPYILCKEIDYPGKEIIRCFGDCGKVALISVLLSSCPDYILGDSLLERILLLVLTILIVSGVSYLFLDKPAKKKISILIKIHLYIWIHVKSNVKELQIRH